MLSRKERIEQKEKLEEWKKTQPQWVQDIWNIEPEEARKLMKEDMKNNRYFEH
jgi:hypothetical protein